VADYVPSDLRSQATSSRFGCYVSVNGVTLNNHDLDAESVSRLHAPADDNFAFTSHFTWHPAQYSMEVIRILAPGVLGLRGEPIGTIVLKGVSIESCKHQRYRGRDAVANQLKPFSSSINDAKALPAEIIQFDVECSKATVSITNQVYEFLRTTRPAIADKVDHLRNALAVPDKRLSIVFHAGGVSLGEIDQQCTVFETISAIDKDKTHPEHPFALFFEKSPKAQQLHVGNAPQPSWSNFPSFDQVMPAVDAFDTPEEQLVALVMGAICDHQLKVDRASGIRSLEYSAHAVGLNHYQAQCFLLLVRPPAEGGIFQSSEGELCYVSLKGIERVLPSVKDDAAKKFSLVDITECFYKTSIAAQPMRNATKFIKDSVQKFFDSEKLTSDMIGEIERRSDEDPHQFRTRIHTLVGAWNEADLLDKGLLDVDEAHDSIPIVEEVDKCLWWRAERVATPVFGVPPEYSTYLVTIPLVPKCEADKDGNRALINVSFPILKWDEASAATTNPHFVTECVTQHFANEKMKLTVLFKPVLSDNTLRAAVSAINDLHTPQSADKEFPVSAQSIKTYKFLMDFKNAESSNAFDMFPQLGSIITNVEEVHPYLRGLWDIMDGRKKAVYRSLENLVQNIKPVIGVAGTGKTILLEFIILMAMFGDKDTEHPAKILYVVNHNAAVSDFADSLNQKFADMGKQHAVIRLHGYEREILDWKPSSQGRRGELFDEEDARRACAGLDDQFMAYHQLAKLSIDVKDATARSRKPKLPYLSLMLPTDTTWHTKPSSPSCMMRSRDLRRARSRTTMRLVSKRPRSRNSSSTCMHGTSSSFPEWSQLPHMLPATPSSSATSLLTSASWMTLRSLGNWNFCKSSGSTPQNSHCLLGIRISLARSYRTA
jgi:hypothetical protein